MDNNKSVLDNLNKGFKELGIHKDTALNNISQATPVVVRQGSLPIDIKTKIEAALVREKELTDPNVIAAVRNRISEMAAERLKGISGHDELINLGDKIDSLTAYYRPSHVVSLQTLYEKRELGQDVKPYDGEDIQTPTTTKDNIDLWKLNVPASNEFKEKRERYVINSSRKIIQCQECHGNGSIPCTGCNSTGRIHCQACSGNGKSKCSRCENGRTKCFHCMGAGYSGSGANRRPCNYCQAKGYKPCTAPSCKDGFITCETCMGTGVITCDTCSGSTQETCPTCDGARKVVDFIYVDSIMTPFSSTVLVSNPTVALKLDGNELLLNDDRIAIDGSVLRNTPDVEITQKTIPGEVANYFDHVALKQAVGSIMKSIDSRERVCNQRLSIHRIDLIDINYSYLKKSYSMKLLGDNFGLLHTTGDPVQEVGTSYISLAKQAYEEKDYAKALELLANVLQISPGDQEAENLKKQTMANINGDYFLGGIVGGVLAAVGARLFWARSAPFWGDGWWDIAKVILLLLGGFFTGTVIAAIFYNKLAAKIKSGTARFFGSFILTTIIICAATVALYLYFNR